MERLLPPVGFIWSGSGNLTAVTQDEPPDLPHPASQRGSTSLTNWYLKRAQGYELFLLKLRSSQIELQIRLGRNAPPGDNDIKGLYTTLQQSITRIVQTYYFSSGIGLSLESKAENSSEMARKGEQRFSELSQDSEHLEFLLAWGDRVELRVLQAAKVIFEMIRESLLEPSNIRTEGEAKIQMRARRPNDSLSVGDSFYV